MAQLKVRSFLAIELSDTVKSEAFTFIQTIQSKCHGFRFLDSKNWHLTLHFFGQVEPEKIEKVGSHLQDALSDVQPFSIFLEGFGAFPDEQNPRILWIGVGGDLKELSDLKCRVDQVLQKMHFPIETRSFHPHITIARSKGEVVCSLPKFEQIFKSRAIDQVRSLVLFKSNLLPQGAQYTALRIVSLANS